MIQKFVSIKNIGRFQSYSAGGDVALKRYNLIFAENGRGKSTLCAILRSLQTGETAYLFGRKTLGSVGVSETKLLMENTSVTEFNGHVWNRTIPELLIFDSTFISENVFSGDSIDIDHKRSLYRVIVGRQGVDLARRIEELDGTIRLKNTEIKDRASVISINHAPRGFPFESFMKLGPVDDVDTAISSKEKELESVKQADLIKVRPGLTVLRMPALPATFQPVLEASLAGLANDAEQRVTAQMQKHEMDNRGEAWLSAGVSYVHDDLCPFCDQPLSGVSDLIAAYKAFFSDGYKGLRSEIATLRQQVESALGDREIAAFEKTIDQNSSAVAIWSTFCEVTHPAALPSGACDKLRALRVAAFSLLDRKAAAPLEAVPLSQEFHDADQSALAIRGGADIYNEGVKAANVLINERKSQTAKADHAAVDASLTQLRAIRNRYEPAAIAACTNYDAALSQKKTLEDEKKSVRDKLDAYTKTVIGAYEGTINRLLGDFNAGFSITKTEHGYPGGVASSTYQILINGTAVELGDDKTPLNKASFRNTLSGGDKSTLALAFFLAQLEHDPKKACRIVVFDDPFSSQDSFRKDCTVHKIKRCGETCKQVFVFSHELSFLKRIWDRLKNTQADRKCLTLDRIGQANTVIREFDIEKATQDQYRADLFMLSEYYRSNEGNPRDIVQKIRPVLETHCRNLGGGLIAEDDMLGPIIGKVRAAGSTHQLYPLLEDLEEVNEYTNRYHHGANIQASIEPITDGELFGYVKRTLQMTGGC